MEAAKELRKKKKKLRGVTWQCGILSRRVPREYVWRMKYAQFLPSSLDLFVSFGFHEKMTVSSLIASC